MQRRDFVALLGGAAVTWPLAAFAQQPEGMRRIGVLMLYPESDPQGQLRATAFRQGLEKLGWVVGRNVQIDFQWGYGDADWIRPQPGARSRAGCRTSAGCDWLQQGSSRPNSGTSIDMRTQLAPITLVNSLLIVSIVVEQAGREQIVAGLPLPTHRGQARHRQRDHNVDLVLLLQLVEPPASR
jgi:hypothetical protein